MMSAAERDALREKHKQMFWYCGFCDFPYPCDVIKVLDAWDFERNMQKIVDISEELGLPE